MQAMEDAQRARRHRMNQAPKLLGFRCVTALFVVCSSAHCGVIEYPQTQPLVDSASDLAAAGSGEHATAAEMSGASGVTIQLGTDLVAKEDVIAFIHIGHSNMAGRGGRPDELRPYFFDETNSHAWMYHPGSPPELAKEPFTAGDDAAALYRLGGPGVALLKQAVEMAPDKHFMSLGFGRANAWCSQYLPGGLYYDAMMAAPKAVMGRVTFAGIVIMLGITEHDEGERSASEFAECIKTVVTAIRTDLGQPDLPLLLNGYEQESTGAYAVGGAVASRIIPEISKVPGMVHNSVIVPSEGVTMQDDHHFDLNGHKIWSRRVLDVMKEKAWFPWAKSEP
jgi:Carbohydrate esterase, sialic acid-specific acetylesterase